MASSGERTIEVDGRRYRLPLQATVVVRVDGCEFAYLDAAVVAGVAPSIGKMLAGGAAFKGDCVIPSFTDPNHLSIVCGVPPSVHGICGNDFWDPQANGGAGATVMMNDLATCARARCSPSPLPSPRRAPRWPWTPAKDKVRGLLGWQLNGICFSAVTRLINELRVGTLNVGGSAGYRIELTPFGGIKALGLGYKEGVQEAMKSFANLKTLSLP
jgi:phosphonoacetate hydrolase